MGNNSKTTAPQTVTAQVATIAKGTPAPAGNPVAPAKVRAVAVTQNGIPRPKPGLCLAIWTETERVLAAKHVPTVALLRDYAHANGYNVNNAQIEFYRCMRFNGVDPRSARTQANKALAEAASATK